MSIAVLRVTGPQADRLASTLYDSLIAQQERVEPVEVQRSGDTVIAIISLTLTGIQTAKTVWDWWTSKGQPDKATVTVLFESGKELNLTLVDQEELEATVSKNV